MQVATTPEVPRAPISTEKGSPPAERLRPAGRGRRDTEEERSLRESGDNDNDNADPHELPPTRKRGGADRDGKDAGGSGGAEGRKRTGLHSPSLVLLGSGKRERDEAEGGEDEEVVSISAPARRRKLGGAAGGPAGGGGALASLGHEPQTHTARRPVRAAVLNREQYAKRDAFLHVFPGQEAKVLGADWKRPVLRRS